MTRAPDEQLELDFEDKQESSAPVLALPSVHVSASIICFTSHLRLRRVRETEVKDAKLLERIASRVQHFK